MTTELPIEKAMRLHQEGKPAKAREAYQRILKKDPDNIDALHYFGVLNFQQGSTGKALELIQRGLTLKPNNPDAYNNMGNVLLRLGDYQQASLCYKNALAIEPDRIDTLNNLGLLLRRLNQFDESLRLFSKAIELAPNWAEARYNSANTLLELGKVEEAQAAFQLAITMAPKFASAHKRLAMLFYSQQKIAQAKGVYQDWLALEPDNPIAQHMLAAIDEGSTPARASAAYVSANFDDFAQSFDSRLENLGYQSPQIMAEYLATCISANSDQLILDAGCGTGLCGPLLKPYAKKLIGVDLSNNMLSRAREGGCYDRLVHADLIDHLTQYQQKLDLIVSTDTLIYIGDLSQVMVNIAGALKLGGRCLFSLESADAIAHADARVDDGFCLQVHGRYLHYRKYIEDLIDKANLTLERVTEHTVRQELGKPVAGLLFSVVKNG